MLGERTKALVGGDDPAHHVTLKRRLSDEGFEIMTTDGGEALLVAHSSWNPNVILLNLGLDTVYGFLVCERIRAVDPSVAIIILSDQGSEEDVSGSLDAGADDYITRPFSME